MGSARRELGRCNECGELGVICWLCDECRDCCECDDPRFDRDELGVDPEEDE